MNRWECVQVTLTSLKDRVIILKIENGKPVGKGTINGQADCSLQRVFVYSTTSWGLPKVRTQQQWVEVDRVVDV